MRERGEREREGERERVGGGQGKENGQKKRREETASVAHSCCLNCGHSESTPMDPVCLPVSNNIHVCTSTSYTHNTRNLKRERVR